MCCECVANVLLMCCQCVANVLLMCCQCVGGSIVGKLSFSDVLQRIQDGVGVLQAMRRTKHPRIDDERVSFHTALPLE